MHSKIFIPANILLSLLALILTGCISLTPQQTGYHLKVGVTKGVHAEIMSKVEEEAAQRNLFLEIIEFPDYIEPNTALDKGLIDANSFQPGFYLEHIVRDRQLDLTAAAKTIIMPMGIYSKKLKSLDTLPEGAVVAIPRDPYNISRALLLLSEAGVLKLKPAAGLNADPSDITDNPYNIRIKTLPADKLPEVLPEVELAVINANFAKSAGLNPHKDALALETAQSPYAHVLAVKTSRQNDPALKLLIETYHSPEIKHFIEEKYQGAVIAAW